MKSNEYLVQIVIAGKAHPKKISPEKASSREIVQLSRDVDLWKYIVFVEDYDMKVARELVQGVGSLAQHSAPGRVESPRAHERHEGGHERCAESFGVLDGWFDEAYEISGGWAIGDREAYSEEQDAIHASNIYYLLEREIVPLFYSQSEGSASSEWARRMKDSMMNLTPRYDARRMVSDYAKQLYDPAHLNWERTRTNDFAGARERSSWNLRVREIWPTVNFVSLGSAPSGPVVSGRPANVRASLRLGGLKPEDLRVECVIGRIGSSGGLEETEVVVLPSTSVEGDVAVYERDIVPAQTGNFCSDMRCASARIITMTR